ncbi:MAG TPA: electron transfer flavoprotein subunit alpha [Flavobacteriales bacterium]|jgi:electron transfer flavoprotein beta subunit|nr:electron transfer flavoprotein subunit alpha [Flavobacteriales bacterium]
MKLLVCISQAPDTTSRIAFTNGNTEFDSSGVQYIVNPYDEWYALVRAIELKEKHGGTVTTLTVGEAGCDPVIRKALAIGADDAIRVDVKPTDAMQVARLIADQARSGGYDIILCGKETIDHNGAVVPAMVAEMLDCGFVSNATHLDVAGSQATLKREAAGGEEVVGIECPFVLSAAKGMAEQRIPNMRGIMSARTKPLAVESAESTSATAISQFTLPPEKGACKMVDADRPEELIRLLREEAKAI